MTQTNTCPWKQCSRKCIIALVPDSAEKANRGFRPEAAKSIIFELTLLNN